jgi:nucleoside phosphorylase/CheY-like chemotaxis protein
LIHALVVEDDSEKLRTIVRCLREAHEFSGDEIRHAPDVVSAKRLLREHRFDILVLDVALPSRVGDDIRMTAGIDLLREVFERPGYFVPSHVIGLTGHDGIFDDAVKEFSASVLTVLRYGFAPDEWSAPLQRFVRNVALAVSTPTKPSRHESFLAVICALHSPEFDSILNLPWHWRAIGHTDDYVTYYEGWYEVDGIRRRVVAACAGRKGMPSSAVLASKIIALFRPTYLAMTGITAGVEGRAYLGDVIAAEFCWDWGSGKWVTGNGEPVFQAAPYQVAIDQDTRERLIRLKGDAASLLSVEEAWKGPKPSSRLTLRIGPVASGASVLADTAKFAAIKAQHRELVGAEMEIYGVFVAAEEGLRPQARVFSLKAVVDFADASKSDDFQAYGAYVSAAVLQVFAEKYL